MRFDGGSVFLPMKITFTGDHELKTLLTMFRHSQLVWKAEGLSPKKAEELERVVLEAWYEISPYAKPYSAGDEPE